MSTIVPENVVPLLKWRLALAVLVTVCLSGILLILVIAAGATAPPHAPTLQFTSAALVPGNRLPAPPYTIELNAINSSPTLSAWGIWIGLSKDNARVFLVDNEGYLSVTQGADRNWMQFIPIRPQTNLIYLNVEMDGTATFCVNGEIAWHGTMTTSSESRWGIATEGQPQFHWTTTRIFVS